MAVTNIRLAGESRWLSRLERASGTLGATMGLLSGALFFVTAGYIVVDVLGRNYGTWYSGATDEMSGYALAIGTTWAMAFTLRKQGHVIVDVFTTRLPARVQALLSLLALASMLVFAAVLARFTWGLAIGSYQIGAESTGITGTPLFLPQALMAVGFTMLLLESLILLLCGTARLLAGQARQAVGEHI